MLEWWQGIALGGATVLTGLMAGLYFAFSIAVMPGLGQGDDRTFVRAMQGINARILNGWFGLAFAGAPVLTAVATGLHLGGSAREVVPWALAAFVLYAATLALTFRLNVPLNDVLDEADAAEDADPAEATAARERFETRWVRGNTARTLLSTAAFGCLAAALALHGTGR